MSHFALFAIFVVLECISTGDGYEPYGQTDYGGYYEPPARGQNGKHQIGFQEWFSSPEHQAPSYEPGQGPLDPSGHANPWKWPNYPQQNPNPGQYMTYAPHTSPPYPSTEPATTSTTTTTTTTTPSTTTTTPSTTTTTTPSTTTTTTPSTTTTTTTPSTTTTTTPSTTTTTTTPSTTTTTTITTTTSSQPSCLPSADGVFPIGGLRYDTSDTAQFTTQAEVLGTCPCSGGLTSTFFLTSGSGNPSETTPAVVAKCRDMSQFCMCVVGSSGECFTPLGNTLTEVRFYPFCPGCKMFAFVVDQGNGQNGLQGDRGTTFLSSTQFDSEGKALPMGIVTPYLQARNVSCNGCGSLASNTCWGPFRRTPTAAPPTAAPAI